jgi:sec-independent protein translocase protein TatC
LIFIRPTEVFFGYIKLALFVGVLLGAPFVLYQIWQFIVPALFPHERKYARYGFLAGAGLFYLGAFGCLFFVVPIAIKFLIELGGKLSPSSVYVRELYLVHSVANAGVWGLV